MIFKFSLSLVLLSLFVNTIKGAKDGLYSITVKDHKGDDVSMSKFEGKALLIVNVASLCGYTDSTYRALTRLHDILNFGGYFSVLAFPCNQFGEQEPRDAPEILAAMEDNYGIEFPMFDKIDVTGPNASPLYKFLIDQTSVVPDWNFFKYLVSSEGEVLNAWGTTTTIEEIFEEIQAAVEDAKKAGKGDKILQEESKTKEDISDEKKDEL
ncbi:hypothetical protein Avbf_13547 [Armadillidium vulgare]|nr:hypothetical protein Avbf_13547 [Armadillidium vulgare]